MVSRRRRGRNCQGCELRDSRSGRRLSDGPRGHENYFNLRSFDHDQICAGRNDLLDGRAPMVYLSLPSLKDPQARSNTAEIVAPFTYRTLEAFREEPWKRRGTDYESTKACITQALLDLVEKQHPGFRDLVAYAELATPLTFEYFT